MLYVLLVSFTVDTTFCPLDSQWPVTAPGTTRYGNCPLGYEGQASRYCSAAGTWAEVNLSQCYQLTCAGDDVWPETPRGEQAIVSCPAHMTGNQVRLCQVDSTWGPVNQSGCVAHRLLLVLRSLFRVVWACVAIEHVCVVLVVFGRR